MSDQFFWYVTRSAAIVCWLCAAGSILAGSLTSSRLLGPRPTVPWLTDLHRFLSSLSMAFLALHMVSLWLDGFVQFRFDDLLIPWVAQVPGVSRTGLALGVMSAWLLAIVQATSLTRKRLSPKLWHRIHLVSIPAFVLGSVHGVWTGSDIANRLLVAAGVSISLAVVLVMVGRLFRSRQYTVQTTDEFYRGGGGSRDLDFDSWEATGEIPVTPGPAGVSRPGTGLSTDSRNGPATAPQPVVTADRPPPPQHRTRRDR